MLGHSRQKGGSRSAPGGTKGRRLWAVLGVRTVAGEVFLLQVAVVLLLVVAAAVALVLQARSEGAEDARHRSRAAAEGFALAPGVAEAIESPNANVLLQPRIMAAQEATGVEGMSVLGSDGLRLAHTDPAAVGTSAGPPPPRVLAGQTVTTILRTPGGPAYVTTVPVFSADGRFVGGVSAAITTERVGNTVERQMPVLLGGTVAALAVTAGGTALISRRLRRQTRGLGPVEMTRMYEHHDAVLHAVREGVLIIGADGRLLLANDEARRLLGLSADAEGRHVGELGREAGIAELLISERSATDEVHLAGDRLLAVNKRPTEPFGGQAGSVVTLRDSTELRALAGRAEVARERLQLLYDAGVRIGTTLDVTRTAEELAEVAVPLFADIATVDLLEPVLTGGEPTGTRMRRAAVHRAGPAHPLHPVGEPITWERGIAVDALAGQAVLKADLTIDEDWATYPERAREILDHDIHSLITVPLMERDVVFGLVNFWRGETPEPFDGEDLSLAEELAARAALAIDNARRYTREHNLAVTLQRDLLPGGLPEQNAMDVAHRYLPAQAGVGGDWFDVIPLPGSRVALVVGDVVGHGLHAAATMGRLRTAAHSFSTLDLPPDEVLAHLDELVSRIDREHTDESGGVPITGATCLYVIYDPITGAATMARAGHPGPALLLPDGQVTFPDVPVSPPLGLAGTLPIETAELQLPEGSSLVLFTDGLIEDRNRDLDVGLDMLRAALATGGPDRTPDQTCAAVLEAMLPPRPSDDIALLVARTRLLAPDRIAAWDVDSRPEAVSPVRNACTRQLEAWGLDKIAFSTGLILSELITNAVRYGTQPIRVRLLHDRILTCEVSDGSSTSPHLRRAATTDEGGRGLFLVAQYAEHWGTRYTPRGKVIWTEQSLHNGAGPVTEDTDALLDQWDDAAW
jgi:serine phosphatase RsbU (regulator of sigma subunit)/PAS domain-containing protein/anti-sigma regulatory factor (Ser/Thr protein kinase)